MECWESDRKFGDECYDAMSSAQAQLRDWEIDMQAKGDEASDEDYNIGYIYDIYERDVRWALEARIEFLREGKNVAEETEFALVAYHAWDILGCSYTTVLNIVLAGDIDDEDVEEVVLTFKAKEASVSDSDLTKIADAVAKWENKDNEDWISNWWDLMYYKDMD